MTNADDDFLNIYQQVQSQSKVALKYFLATNSLDNRNSCFLLNENVKSGNLHTKKISAEIDKSRSKSDTIRDRECNLNRNSLEPLIRNLACSNKPICERSESVTSDQFQDFMTLFNKNRTKEVLAEQRQRTFAKSFVPQTCNSKERFTNISDGCEKQNSENQQDMQKGHFKTARQELNVQRKQGNNSNLGGQKRKLGTRRGIGSKFVSPMLSNESNGDCSSKSQEWVDEVTDDRLKNLDAKMIDLIKSEIMDTGPAIHWNDIAGLEFAKTAIQEAVVWPMLRPDIFTGLRRPPKGILLFGPPGTGKTLIGKCVASQSKSTFFSISASSLTSKWVGDGEKMVRALFTVARCHQPAVIFIDEIDSLLSQRSDTEHESSRRIKTEFLVQLDGATTDNEEKLLVIGATNRPQELDEAARRRFVKRLYIPLPEIKARQQLVTRLMLSEKHELNEDNIIEIAELSDGYSGADMRNLCADASMGPIRSIDMSLMQSIQTTQVRAVNREDFRKALCRVKSSVSPKDLEQYVVWDKTYGSGSLCY